MTIVAVDGTGSLAAALTSGLATSGWTLDDADAAGLAGMVMMAAGDVSDLVKRARDSNAPATVIIVDAEISSALDAHLLIAAVEPLAVDGAPGKRISAIFVHSDADIADVTAATNFLLRAHSVTGQIIRIEPRGPTNA